jgi:hypothetical protein
MKILLEFCLMDKSNFKDITIAKLEAELGEPIIFTSKEQLV